MIAASPDVNSPRNAKLEQMRSRLRGSLFNGQPISPIIINPNGNEELEGVKQKASTKSEAVSPTHETETFAGFGRSVTQTRSNLKSLLEQRNPSHFGSHFADYIQPERDDNRATQDTFTFMSQNFDSKQEIEDQFSNSSTDYTSPEFLLEKTQDQPKGVSSNKNYRIPLQEFTPTETEQLEDVTPSAHTIFQRFFAAEEEKIGSTEEHIHYLSGTFKEHFEELEILGEGTSGTVKRCLRLVDKKESAVKIVNYRGDEELKSLIMTAFKKLRVLKHKNVVEALDLYIDESRGKIYTILELIKGKEMFEKIQESGSYSESDASAIFKQILFAIQYLHLNGVCHRDLKPNNILVSEDEELKSRYTGLSTENYKMWTYTGTVAFIAPEVFNEAEYTYFPFILNAYEPFFCSFREAVDMWSAGVVLYTILCGYQPFQAEYVQDLIELIKKGEVSFEEAAWENISDEAKDLVSRLLNKNYKKRYTPAQALAHPWIKKVGRVTSKKLSATLQNLKCILKKKNSKNKDLADHIPGDTPNEVMSLPHVGSFTALDVSPLKTKCLTAMTLEDVRNGTIILDSNSSVEKNQTTV